MSLVSLPGFGDSAAHIRPGEADLAGFEDWWQSYPRKRAKGDAMRAYRACLKMGMAPAELARAVAALNEEIRSLATELKYVPYPATFLRRRVEDYMVPGEDSPSAPTPAPETVRVRDGRTERWYPGAGWVREYVAGDG